MVNILVAYRLYSLSYSSHHSVSKCVGFIISSSFSSPVVIFAFFLHLLFTMRSPAIIIFPSLLFFIIRVRAHYCSIPLFSASPLSGKRRLLHFRSVFISSYTLFIFRVHSHQGIGRRHSPHYSFARVQVITPSFVGHFITIFSCLFIFHYHHKISFFIHKRSPAGIIFIAAVIRDTMPSLFIKASFFSFVCCTQQIPPMCAGRCRSQGLKGKVMSKNN